MDEPDETFELQLLYPINATAQRRAVGTILDNDLPPKVSVTVEAGKPVMEGASVEFVLTLSRELSEQVVVGVHTEGGTATAGDDYEDDIELPGRPAT